MRSLNSMEVLSGLKYNLWDKIVIQRDGGYVARSKIAMQRIRQDSLRAMIQRRLIIRAVCKQTNQVVWVLNTEGGDV